jgi:DNA-binding NarL/FixJ family response regulator
MGLINELRRIADALEIIASRKETKKTERKAYVKAETETKPVPQTPEPPKKVEPKPKTKTDTLPRNHKRWAKEEERLLSDLRRRGSKHEDIAKVLGRTSKAIDEHVRWIKTKGRIVETLL